MATLGRIFDSIVGVGARVRGFFVVATCSLAFGATVGITAECQHQWSATGGKMTNSGTPRSVSTAAFAVRALWWTVILKLPNQPCFLLSVSPGGVSRAGRGVSGRDMVWFAWMGRGLGRSGGDMGSHVCQPEMRLP